MSCTTLYTEDFTAGIGAYTVVIGSPGVWTVGTGGTYGDFMQISGGSPGIATIRRSIVSGSANAFDIKVQVTSTGTSGAGFMELVDSGFSGPLIVPRDNVSSDASQRCGINPGSGILYFTSGALSIGTWYQISIRYSPTSGASTATLTNLTTMTTDMITFPGTIANRNVTTIQFTQGASSGVAGVEYSDIVIENCPAGNASFTASTTTPTVTGTVSFTDTSTPSGELSWAWDFGDGNTSTAQNPTHSYSTPGNYSVILTTTWSFGSVASNPTVINVHQTTFNTSTVIPAVGDIVTFTDTSGPGSALSWAWNFGDGNTSTLESPTHTYVTGGNYNVVLTTTWSFGSFASSPTVVHAHSETFAVSDATPNTGNSITFTDTSAPSGALSWAWNFGDSGTSTLENPSHTYASSGSYNVVLTTTWSFGSFASSPTTIHAHTESFSASTTTPTIGETVTFTDSSTPSGIISWFWSFGDGGTSTLQNPTHAYGISGTFNVTVTVTWGFGAFTSSPRVITVDGPLMASFIKSPPSGRSPLVVTFVDTSIGGPTGWMWNFGDGGTSTLQNPQHTYNSPGFYTVDLTISKAAHLDSSASGSVTVSSVIVPIYGEILPVPDPALSEAEMFGIQYRPRQGMFENVFNARQIFVQAANALLQHIPIRDSNPSWDADVITDTYWKYVNWYEIGYENVVPTIVFPTLAAANTALIAGQLALGTILQVTAGTPDGRYILYAVIQTDPNIDILSLLEVSIQNSAIQLLNTIYTTINKYGLAVELRELLYAFRTQIFVDANLVDQNDLFFSMLNFVVSEQKNPDWVFKSSYIFIRENGLPLTQTQFFIPDQIDNVINYIIDSKPYHTQIRDYTSSYVTTDLAFGTAIDGIIDIDGNSDGSFARKNFKLGFGPEFAGKPYLVPSNIVDPQIGWDFSQGPDSQPWDSMTWDNSDIANVINQFISRNNILAPDDPGAGPWPDTYQISLTDFDTSKIGFSALFPYTFNFDSLNLDNPQTFITPANIIAIQVGPNTLMSGQDYYVTDNGDGTYTAYFFTMPASTPLAFVWIDGGDLLEFTTAIPNEETANTVVLPDMVINVDTKLAVNDYSHMSGMTPIFGGPYTPYVAPGDSWDPAGPVADIIIAAGGSSTVPGVPLNPNPPLLTATISFKENVNPTDGPHFYRNATVWEGVLTVDTPAPSAATNNITTFTVFVNPVTHPGGTDILFTPTDTVPGVIWVNGERVQYRHKTLVAVNTWELSLVYRGTMGTGVVDHPMGSFVFVEENNILTSTSNIDVWNASDTTPDAATRLGFDELPWDFLHWDEINGYSNITTVPAGGLWYATTAEAEFLIEAPGKAIP